MVSSDLFGSNLQSIYIDFLVTPTIADIHGSLLNTAEYRDINNVAFMYTAGN